MAEQQFDLNDFFDGVAGNLHSQKCKLPGGREITILQTIDPPLGEPKKNRPRYSKTNVNRPHLSESYHNAHLFQKEGGHDKDMPGTVWHVGDVPYDMLTFTELRKDKGLRPSQKEIALKQWSVTTAIKHYLPTDKFQEFLGFFTQCLADKQFNSFVHSEYYSSLGVSLHRMMNQTELSDDMVFGDTLLSHEQLDALIEEGNGNQIRAAGWRSPALDALQNYPELAVSFAMFHAAHRSYLDELKSAISRAHEQKTISDDEFANASFTLNTVAFKQFNSFLLFNTLLPLVIHEYRKSCIEAGEKPPEGLPDARVAASGAEITGSGLKNENKPINHERMKKAIHTAWETFLDTHVLRRDFGKDGHPPADGGPGEKSITCPAILHLREAFKSKTLEKLYDTVVANRELYQTHISDAQQYSVYIAEQRADYREQSGKGAA